MVKWWNGETKCSRYHETGNTPEHQTAARKPQTEWPVCDHPPTTVTSSTPARPIHLSNSVLRVAAPLTRFPNGILNGKTYIFSIIDMRACGGPKTRFGEGMSHHVHLKFLNKIQKNTYYSFAFSLFPFWYMYTCSTTQYTHILNFKANVHTHVHKWTCTTNHAYMWCVMKKQPRYIHA